MRRIAKLIAILLLVVVAGIALPPLWYRIFLAAENLDNAMVVGWSYGGGTAIVAARTDASRIAGLVLLSSVGPGIETREAPPEWLLEFMRGPGLTWLASVPPLERRLRGALTANAFNPAPVQPDYLTLLDANFGRPHTLDTFRSEGRDLDGRADLDPRPLDLPILVIHGDDDLLVPRSVGEQLHRRAQHGDLWIVENGSHMLPITHTHELADRISAFAHANSTTP